LEIDKSNRRLSLGHKQLEENPWNVLETMFTVDSVHEGMIVEMMDKGAVISLPYGVEGFATPKHLIKEDGSQAQVDEKLSFKVIEFNKDAKRIIVSHSRIHEDVKRAERAEANGEPIAPVKKSSPRRAKKEETASSASSMEKTTLGDIESLANLKDQMVEAAAKTAAKTAKKAKAAKEEAPKAKKTPAAKEEVEVKVEVKEETPVEEAPKAEPEATTEA
jgi:small subunit ribosomal protein S1